MFIAIGLTMGLNGAGHRSSIAAGEIENAGAVRGDDNTGRDDYGMEEWDGEGRRRQMMHAVHADEEEGGDGAAHAIVAAAMDWLGLQCIFGGL